MQAVIAQQSPVDFAARHRANRPQRGAARSVRVRPRHRPGLSPRLLRRENDRFHGCGGVSEENRGFGFRPAFLDAGTQAVYLSRFASGEPAPFHLLDGLPDQLVLARDAGGRVTAVKATLVSGFVLEGRFYDREAAARKVAGAA